MHAYFRESCACHCLIFRAVCKWVSKVMMCFLWFHFTLLSDGLKKSLCHFQGFLQGPAASETWRLLHMDMPPIWLRNYHSILRLTWETFATKHRPWISQDLFMKNKRILPEFWINSAAICVSCPVQIRVLECSVCESALFSKQHGSFELSHSQTRVLHNL